MVAGAYKDDLLADFREAVDKAITQGTTLEDFRKDVDRIVATHGWDYNGGRNWRSRVIYETNVRQAYNAGRWKQMTDPETMQILPYLQYRHGDSRRPRPQHLAWDGITLPAEDPWWQTHYPQNGWGCKCKVFAVSERRMEKARAKGKAQAPPSPIDPKTGAPVGIDKGFDYNVGTAALGKSWVREAGNMKELGPWRKEMYPFLPQKLSGEKPPVALGRECKTESQLRSAVPEGIYRDILGEETSVTQALADHIIEKPGRWDGREQYFPLIPDVIEHAQEVWIGFIQFEDSGRVFLRKRYVKAYEIEKGRLVGVLADTIKGQMITFDAFQSKDLTGGRLRSGRLVYPTEK